ncbi:MAG: Flp pilus assembly protein CpaB, partial [Syntrophomonas sp.]
MLKGSRKYWFIALVFGLAAAILSYRYMQDIKASYSPSNLVQVVKARQAIAPDTVIKKEQLEVVQLPSKYAHPDAFTKKDMVIGKIATSDISAGEEILKEKLLSPQDKERRLSYKIPPSKRAISIPINNVSGVSGYIKPGDRVDIIATLDIPLSVSGNEQKTSFSILTLQDVEV